MPLACALKWCIVYAKDLMLSPCPFLSEKSSLPKATAMKPIEEAMEDDVFEADSPIKTDPAPSTSHEEV